MADLTDAATSPDLGQIEQGNMRATADAVWLLYAMILNEQRNRDVLLRDKAPESRQDRLTLMALYT